MDWFAQAQLDVPVLIRTITIARALSSMRRRAGRLCAGHWAARKSHHRCKIIFSERTSDSGANAAHPVALDYQRKPLFTQSESKFASIR